MSLILMSVDAPRPLMMGGSVRVQPLIMLNNGVMATGEGAFHAGTTVEPDMDGNGDDSNGDNTGVANDQDGEDGTQTATSEHDDPFRADFTPSSPPPTCKRPASPPTIGSSSVKRGQNRQNAEVANEVIAAVDRLAAAAFGPVGGTTMSPHGKARAWAIEVLQDDNEFSSDEESDMMLLISKDVTSSISQTYTGCKKKSKRTAFLRKALRDYQDSK
ncbi:unnamed protein product [Mycena citricolor]|uniref:Uncharacterized protein n=1 Tax=Mycena citricolor TaxID=2018698 RepID=A0AAD2GZM9_9AGAR|nr:unnamed protein product [Mycena citricolor]